MMMAPVPTLRSSVDVELRSLNEEKRQAEFVASTENPVRTWGDPEVLRMGGADLDRYRKNPVLLNSHSRHDLSDVIGSCSVKVEGRKMVATATYARTATGEMAWQLVKDGHVRAMSIGYAVDPAHVTRLREGQFDGEGEARVEGPATVANKWKLLEISNVPVPADEDAVRRSFYETLKEAPVADKPNDSVISRAMGDPPAPPPAAPAPKEGKQVRAARRAAEVREAHRREVLAFTPKGLEAEAERCILEGFSVEDSRKRLLEVHAKRYAPLGTPSEPEKPVGKPTIETVTDDDLVRSLAALRS